jgi:hypothetical protein
LVLMWYLLAQPKHYSEAENGKEVTNKPA